MSLGLVSRRVWDKIFVVGAPIEIRTVVTLRKLSDSITESVTTNISYMDSWALFQNVWD